MTSATAPQVQFITKLRTDNADLRAEDRAIQAAPEQIAQVLFDHDFKRAMRKVRAEAKEKGLEGEDRKTYRDQANREFTAAHPLESYLPEAQAILDTDWARWGQIWTADPTTFTKDEASDVIDRLKTPVMATVPAGGKIVHPNSVLAIRETIEIEQPAEAETAEAPSVEEGSINILRSRGETIIGRDAWHRLTGEQETLVRRSEELLTRADAEQDEARAQEWEDLSDHYGHQAARLREMMDDVYAIVPDQTTPEQEDEIELLKITAAANHRDRLAAEADKAREGVQFAVRSAKTLTPDVSVYQLAKRARVSHTAATNWLR